MNSRSKSVSRSPGSPISSIRAYCRRLPCCSCSFFTSGVKAISPKRRLIVPPTPENAELPVTSRCATARFDSASAFEAKGPLQLRNIQLHHPHHRVHHPLRLRLVGVVQHRVHLLRRNLP